MDLSDPTRSVVATLDGAVLAVLASVGQPLTIGQVARLAARGSEIGIRRTMARLVEQGIVRSTLMGRNTVYELNRDHIAAPIVQLLADLRPTLWGRFRKEFDSWHVRPLYACVFGSAARGDGHTGSDIDLLLVRPPSSKGSLSPLDQTCWDEQVDRLHGLVKDWTGNPLQVTQISEKQRSTPNAAERALLAEVDRDGIGLFVAHHLSARPWFTAKR